MDGLRAAAATAAQTSACDVCVEMVLTTKGEDGMPRALVCTWEAMCKSSSDTTIKNFGWALSR